MWKRMGTLTAGLMTVATVVWAQEAGRRYRTTKVDSRPAIWQQAKGKDVMKALEVARHDALRKLIGRMYGLRVDANTEVLDLIDVDQETIAAIHGNLRGFQEAGTTYYEDGSLQPKMQITLRDVVETIRRVYKRVKEAARLFGTRVDSRTRVADFVLAHDRIKSVVAASLKGVRYTDVEVTDQFVKVTGQLVLKTTIERIARTYKRTVENGRLNVENLKKVTTRTEEKTLTETARAAYREKGAEPWQGAGSSYVEKKVVERVLKSEIKIED